MSTLLSSRKHKVCQSNNLKDLQKAISLIEELCLEHDDMCDETKQGGVVCIIYTVCHALNGCSAGGCPVVKEGNKILKELE